MSTNQNVVMPIQKDNAVDIFTDSKKIDAILDYVAAEAQKAIEGHTADTKAGREAIASAAYQVARSKTHIDDVGKDAVAELKELPKKIDANRKRARDFLDSVRDQIRKPVTDWEIEQERIAAEKKAAEDAELLRLRVIDDHEIGLLMNAEFDRQAKAKREAEEAAKIAEVERLAEQKAQKIIAERERQEQLAKQAESVADPVQAPVQAPISQPLPVVEPVKQQEQPQEQLPLIADKKSIAAIKNNEALDDLVSICGLDREAAKNIVRAIALGKIANVSIRYE